MHFVVSCNRCAQMLAVAPDVGDYVVAAVAAHMARCDPSVAGERTGVLMEHVSVRLVRARPADYRLAG